VFWIIMLCALVVEFQRFEEISTRKMWCCFFNRPWRPIVLRDVEDPTISRQSSRRFWWGCQPYEPANRRLPPERLLVLISVRIWVYPKAIPRMDELSQLEKPITSSGTEPAIFCHILLLLLLLLIIIIIIAPRLSPRANYTERPPLVGEVCANFCG
jgi:hypothetical protein